MRAALPLLLAGAAALLAACGGEERDRYSDFHCNLTIDNATHLNTTLGSAMDQNAPGTFCLITTTLHGGATYFVFANNRGDRSESIFNAIDERLESQRHVGQNGRLIVGFGNMDYPARFTAYDGECPNCFSLQALPLRSRPLTLSDAGLATCDACKRVYDLNAEGIVTNNSGHPLTQYRAATSGPLGRLQVY